MKISDQLLIDYLENTLEKEEFDQVEEWLQLEKNQEFLKRTERIWKSAKNAQVFDQIDSKNAKLKVRTHLGEKTYKQKHRTFTFSHLTKIAASILVFLGIGVALYLFHQESQWITISATDTAKEYKLPDGTYVTINKNSELRVAKHIREKRSVKLIGEAFFDVQRDENRPFEVSVGGLAVTVLGTSFNIKETNERTKVTVVSGKVRVSEKADAENHQLLLANDAALFTKERGKVEKEAGDPNAISWKTGNYTFDQTPVIEALQLMAKNLNVAIKISNPEALTSCTITTKFEKQSWSEILDELSLITTLQFQSQGEKTIISGGDCQ